MFERLGHGRPPGELKIALERGRDGYLGSWCLDMPGCFALVPPGADVLERSAVAVLEFSTWAHNRGSERTALRPGQLVVAQSVSSDLDLRAGGSSAFFLHDAEPPEPSEYPLWAHPHDRALDDLRELALSLPPDARRAPLGGSGLSALAIVRRATEMERGLAACLGHPLPALNSDPEAALRELQAAHALLQQMVCDVPPTFRTRAESAPGQFESWSVRKAMRVSIYQLRYQVAQLRVAIAGMWLG